MQRVFIFNFLLNKSIQAKESLKNIPATNLYYYCMHELFLKLFLNYFWKKLCCTRYNLDKNYSVLIADSSKNQTGSRKFVGYLRGPLMLHIKEVIWSSNSNALTLTSASTSTQYQHLQIKTWNSRWINNQRLPVGHKCTQPSWYESEKCQLC